MNVEAEAFKIRSRTTIDADGAETVVFSVGCPERGDTPLESCVRCERCSDLRVGRNAGDAYVVCHLESAPEKPNRAAYQRFPDASAATIAEVMATDVVCVDENVTFRDLAALLVERGISGAPVVDPEGRPVGMVSKTDLLRAMLERDQDGLAGCSDLSVRDIMMPLAFCLPAGESVARAAALMAAEGVHRVPVLSARGQVVGLISPLDVLHWLAARYGYVLSDPHG